jgi:hypothetical protein
MLSCMMKFCCAVLGPSMAAYGFPSTCSGGNNAGDQRLRSPAAPYR